MNIPKLFPWTDGLTADGAALVAWTDASVQALPAQTDTILPSAATYFCQHPSEAAALWPTFQVELVEEQR